MNKNFCLRCLIKLSVIVSSSLAADLVQDRENPFLFTLDDEMSLKTPPQTSQASHQESNLLYYPGTLQNDLFGIDHDNVEQATGKAQSTRHAGMQLPISSQESEEIAQASPHFPAKPADPAPATPTTSTTPTSPPAPATTPIPVTPVLPTTTPTAPPTPAPVTPVLPTTTPAAPPTPTPAVQPAITPGNPEIPPVGDGVIPPQLNQPVGQTAAQADSTEPPQRAISINFNNIGIIEYIRFISNISNKNFIFDDNELQFNVTIVSDEPTTIDNIMTALLQVLRIHGLTLLEQGNNLIIHKNPTVNSISTVVDDLTPAGEKRKSEIITQVFRLNTIEAARAVEIIRPLVSQAALVETLQNTNHLIITDLAANVEQIGKLLKSLDSPKGGLVIGQYVVKQGVPAALIDLTQRIMLPISQDQPLTLVPHSNSNSIFIVATPYLVERALSVMQYLDQNQGTTQILNVQDMRYAGTPGGRWELDSQGNWRYNTGIKADGTTPPQGSWSLDADGNWKFIPGGAPGGRVPEGQWVKDANGNWFFQLAPGKKIAPDRISRRDAGGVDLPVGHIERTKFSIFKLRYRQAYLIEQSLRRIGESLRLTNTNADLVSAIDSLQAIEATNSLIFTGTGDSLAKLKELIEEVDRPLKQVFLELLILETSLNDSLNYGVNWGSRFGGGSSAGSQAFLSASSTLPGGLDTTVAPSLPVATSLARSAGYTLGVLGQHLTHGGVYFNSIGALVSAIHNDARQNIVLNPKILTEDNSPAEIFVGLNIQFPTQAIANNNGNILSQNFEYRDVGVRFKVTPLIGEGRMITLDIEEEKTDIIPNPNPNAQQLLPSNQVLGPSLSKSKTTTRVHMPDGYFLVLSGQIQDKITYVRNQIPCLGGIPVIGAAFAEQRRQTEKSNLMLFIRPLIIETDEEMHNITKHEQDIWKNKNRLKKSWKYETQEALRYFNLKDELYPTYDLGEIDFEP